MELSTTTQLLTKNNIPVYGVESASNNEAESKQKSSAKEISTNELSNEDKCSLVAKLAYYKAEARGFESGHELEDWLSAEDEVNR